MDEEDHHVDCRGRGTGDELDEQDATVNSIIRRPVVGKQCASVTRLKRQAVRETLCSLAQVMLCVYAEIMARCWPRCD